MFATRTPGNHQRKAGAASSSNCPWTARTASPIAAVATKKTAKSAKKVSVGSLRRTSSKAGGTPISDVVVPSSPPRNPAAALMPGIARRSGRRSANASAAAAKATATPTTSFSTCSSTAPSVREPTQRPGTPKPTSTAA